jgi:ABC-type antimicrobial peptide transport system permease subunit
MRTVVGVVRDIKVRGLERSSEPQLYLPARQFPPTLGGLYTPKDLVIRTSMQTGGILPQVREIIRKVDPEQPISNVRLLSEVVERQTASRRAQLQVLGALSLIAVLLTGVGIHGLLAFLVAQRSREIGVRLALGAERGRVARMIVKEAGLWTLIGCIPGILLAYAAARGMQALLFGIGPSDPLTIGTGLVVVLIVSLAGSLLPALRAVRISPLLAMRTE